VRACVRVCLYYALLLEGQARVFICFQHQFIKKLPVLVSPVILYIEMVARETSGSVCAILIYPTLYCRATLVLSEDIEHSFVYNNLSSMSMRQSLEEERVICKHTS
jgi:hypothetical protein